MANYKDDYTDKELSKLEKRISKAYKGKQREIDYDVQRNIADIESEYQTKLAQLKNGKITEEEFHKWYSDNVPAELGDKGLIDDIADGIHDANKDACVLINDTTPDVYAEVKNFSAYECAVMMEREFKIKTSFEIVDRDAIKVLMRGDNHVNFRVNSVNRRKDYNWNAQRITNELMEGIRRGESPKKIANRFYNVMGSNHTAAIRNARTSIMSARNAGDYDQATELYEMGYDVELEWQATYDNRTRESHEAISGEKVMFPDLFSNGLRYPADPNGEPAEVYNCRCTMYLNILGVRAEATNDDISFDAWKEENDGDNN